MKYFYQYINSDMHFDIKAFLNNITYPRVANQMVDIMDDFMLIENQGPKESGQGDNFVIYTPSYDYNYYQNKEMRSLIMET